MFLATAGGANISGGNLTVVVEGFPFVLPDFSGSLNIYYPFLVPKLGQVKYVVVNQPWYTTDASNNGYLGAVLQFCALNKANPDWQNRQPGVITQVIGGLTGEGVIPVSNLTKFEVVIKKGQNKVDHWYNSTIIGKYGQVSLGTGLGVSDFSAQNKITWVNTPFLNVDDYNAIEDQSALYYNFVPGVEGEIFLFGTSSQFVGTNSSVPAVGYSAVIDGKTLPGSDLFAAPGNLLVPNPQSGP